MIVNNQKLVDYEGKVIKNGEEELDLKTVIVNALNHLSQKLTPTAEEKMRSYLLSMDFMMDNEVSLKSEDIVYIKTRLLEIYNPLVFGQVMQILEPTDKKVDKNRIKVLTRDSALGTVK